MDWLVDSDMYIYIYMFHLLLEMIDPPLRTVTHPLWTV